MSELGQKLDGLSEEQRRLLQRLLEKEGIELAEAVVSERRDAPEAPLSYTQERLWTSGELAPGTAFGNLPLAFRVTGPLDLEALSRSVRELATRHEILRTTYTLTEGQPLQRVYDPVEVPLRREDVSALPAAERLDAALRLATDEALRPFDLSRELQLRTLAVRLDADDHLLLLVTHHIATDGWGIRILLRELATCYAAFVAGDAPALPVAPMQYKDFSIWQREHVRSGALDAQLDYWRKRLDDAPTSVAFPARRTNASHVYAAGSIEVEIDAKLSEALRKLSRDEGVTLYMTLLAAFQSLLYGYTGQSDLALGSIISNRTRRDTEQLVGNFGNNVFCRLDFSDGPSFREVLKRVREEMLSAQRNQDLPLETLIDECLAAGRSSVVPRFQVMFIVRDSPLVQSLEIAGLRCEELTIKVDLMPLDLNLDLTDGEAEIRGFLAYNRNLLDEAVASRLVDGLGALLQEAVADPDHPVGGFGVAADLAELREDAAGPAPGGAAAEPRDEIERTLAKLWSDALGVSPVGIRDDFFALGGHSLVAVRLFAQARRAFGIDWPLSVLFRAPTVEQLAQLVREAREGGSKRQAGGHPAAPCHELAVAMRPGPGAGETPFFVVAGAYGNVLNLMDLATAAGAERPVYGLQAGGLGGDGPLHATVEEAAAEYLREVREIQPQGPYLLGGFCTGGIAAFEMARQLRSLGEAVPLLVLLDAPLPNPADALTARDRLKIHRQRLRERGWAYPFQWARGRASYSFGASAGAWVSPQEEMPPRSEEIFRQAVAAMEAYAPQPYPGRALLLRPPLDRRYVLGPGRAIDEGRNFLREDNGWGAFIGDLEVHEVAAAPGDHDGFILQPALADFAELLRRQLRDASR